MMRVAYLYKLSSKNIDVIETNKIYRIMCKCCLKESMILCLEEYKKYLYNEKIKGIYIYIYWGGHDAFAAN